MNRNTLITIAAVGVLAYLLLRKKPQAKEVGQAPDANTGNKKVDGVDKGTVTETTATLKAKGVKMPKRKTITVEQLKVPVKQPIYVAPTNSIPNIYDRSVGQPLFADANGSESYYNMSGVCTEDIQKACNCAKEGNQKYYLDVPSLP